MISIIVAKSKNNVIGKKGNIPWKIDGEQKQFRELTTGNVVIMGRRTYEDIGHPLPNRMNIVVSNSGEYEGENLATAKSLKEALDIAERWFLNTAGERDVFIAGGYRLFKEAIPIVDKIYITEIDTIVEDGDTFFPEFDKNQFYYTVEEMCTGRNLSNDNNDDIKFTRTVYTRK